MFRMSKSSLAWLFFLILLCREICLCSASALVCIEEERQALLKFKQSFTFGSEFLSSWHGKDCCNWRGIKCDGATSHVIRLGLQPADPDFDGLKANQVNSSLLELKHLNHLDLSGIDFGGSSIPEFLGLMPRLRYLNLSNAQFTGTVTHHLGNLSCLHVLDLGLNYATVDDLTWISRLSLLQYLDMSKLNLSQAGSLSKVLDMLPSLKMLRLSDCALGRIQLSYKDPLNSTINNMQYLDLSNNNMGGGFPQIIENMTSLRFLDLSANGFNSYIPIYLENLKNLEILNLDSNEFEHIEGGLLRFLLNHCSLRSLDMELNKFGKENISIPYVNIPVCTVPVL